MASYVLYKVDAGTCNRYDPKPTNLSEINFLDFDNRKCFGVGNKVTSLPSLKDSDEVYNFIKENIGVTDTAYGVRVTSQGLYGIDSYFPSLSLMFVNTSNRIISTRTSDGYTTERACYYFKSLKKLMADDGGSAWVFDVLEGGELSFIGTISDSLFYSFSRVKNVSSINDIIWLNVEWSEENVKKQENWQSVSVSGSPGEIGLTNLGSKSNYNILFSDYSPPDGNEPNNPYEPGGESGEGGGNGNFDDTSDPIPDSSLPTLSSSNTGFTRIYNPSLSQVQDLARYLWTDESVIQTIWNHIKQFMENPMDAIIGFNLVPCAVPNGGTKEFALMYIGTGVQMTVAANQFVDVDCGTCELKEYFGSALDYAPYTKISCFLPYIGTVELNVDEVMKSTLQVKYRIDICSGSCVAKILVNGNVLYQYSGHCAISIPISAADFSSYVSAAISVAKLAIGAAVGGGMGAAASLAADPSQQTNQIVTTTQTTETARNPATGRQITMGTRTTVETRESPSDQSSTQASFSGLTPNNIANTVGQIMSSKPHVEHSGSFSGNTGYLGVRRPYLIITRPNQCMPNQYPQFNGFPSMISQELSTLSGFTKVQQVQLTGMTATNPEQAEILEFLKSGVIL